MATIVLKSEKKLEKSLEKKKLEKPLHKFGDCDPRYKPLTFFQASGWLETARMGGQLVPMSSMEIHTLDRNEETDFDDDPRLQMFTWRDNERLAPILDDSNSEMEEQQTNLVEHIDPIDYADLAELKDIFFIMDESVTTTLEE